MTESTDRLLSQLEAYLTEMQNLLSSDSDDRWQNADRIATEIEAGFRQLFAEGTVAASDVDTVSQKGYEMLQRMQSLMTEMQKQRVDMSQQISGLVKGRKGIAAYRKV